MIQPSIAVSILALLHGRRLHHVVQEGFQFSTMTSSCRMDNERPILTRTFNLADAETMPLEAPPGFGGTQPHVQLAARDFRHADTSDGRRRPDSIPLCASWTTDRGDCGPLGRLLCDGSLACRSSLGEQLPQLALGCQPETDTVSLRLTRRFPFQVGVEANDVVGERTAPRRGSRSRCSLRGRCHFRHGRLAENCSFPGHVFPPSLQDPEVFSACRLVSCESCSAHRPLMTSMLFVSPRTRRNC